MATLEPGQNAPVRDASAGRIFEHKQRRQMLAALTVLLLALVLVLIKDREFWFPPAATAETETAVAHVPGLTSNQIRNRISQKAEPAPSPRSKATKLSTAVPDRQSGNESQSGIVVTNRAVLPPLEVEVIGGGQSSVTPQDNSVHVEMQGRSPGLSSSISNEQAQGAYMNANAGQRLQLSPGAAQLISQPVEPNYPLLAKQMKVQGAVVLEALIDKRGNIQDIHVLSGPTILSDAARDAVKQWHFKPYYQSGRPVETEAHITVNFTISTY